MSKFVIEYIIEAEDFNAAASIAHENVYFADIEVEQVRVHPLGDAEVPFRTFDMSNAEPIITDVGLIP